MKSRRFKKALTRCMHRNDMMVFKSFLQTSQTAPALKMDGAQAVQRTSMHVRSSKGHHSDLQAIAQKSGLIKSCCNYKTNVNNSFQTKPFFKVNLVSGVLNGRDNFFGRINGVKSSRQKKLIRRLKNVQKGLKMYRTKGSLSLSLFRGGVLLAEYR